MNGKLFGIGLFFVAVWFFGTEHHSTLVVDSNPVESLHHRRYGNAGRPWSDCGCRYLP